eukprot:TRINITY_DN18772_c0_g1_i9.p1 TRINITY_DN18772_c0_g1~~TRINITY_DN18772_c0_g1_i9.p1  ORF type:complete len:177 (+),score=41.35 TRINITY_DN18772_c0_g1_i9:242-772(+)
MKASTGTMHRHSLPQLYRSFVADGGIETALLYNYAIPLPEFAAFPLVDHPGHRAVLKQWYTDHILLALKHSVGFLFETATWRASSHWANRLGIGEEELERLTMACIELGRELRSEFEEAMGGGELVRDRFVIAGVVGPAADGYTANAIRVEEAAAYHAGQVRLICLLYTSPSPRDS